MFARITKLFVIVFAFVAFSVSAQAENRGTPDEAKTMCEKAAKYLTANGIDNSKAAFQTAGEPWHKDDLYVFVFDTSGITVAHGAKEALVGRDLTKLRDVDGKLFLQEIISVADKGWVDYKWQNPSTQKVEAKTSYVINIGEFIVGVGAYK